MSSDTTTIRVRLTEAGNGFGGSYHLFYERESGQFMAIRVGSGGTIQTGPSGSGNYIECDAEDVTSEYDEDEITDDELSLTRITILDDDAEDE